MKVRISKEFNFDAAHWLPKVSANHKCRRMHGHTYRVELICEGKLDRRGMVLDYAEIADAWYPLYYILDHRTLNDIPGLGNPTTEILAPWIYKRAKKSLRQLKRVRVYESSTTYCEYP